MGDEGEGRRLRPLMAALLMPLLALVVAGGYGLHATLASNGTGVGGPAARSGATMAYDAARDVVVMFGGRGASGATFDDTWTWDGGSWTQQHPKVSPPPLQDALMAADPNTGRVVLVTGWNSAELGAPGAETWSWDGSSWRREHPAHEVQGIRQGMATDPATHQVVLVTQGPPRPAPPPTPLPTPPPAPPGPPSAVLVMPAPMRLMPPTRQTWTWNGSDWSLRDTADETSGMPTGRLAWDARSHSVVLVTEHFGCAVATGGGYATSSAPRVVQGHAPTPSLAPAATPRAAMSPHAVPIDPPGTPGPRAIAPLPRPVGVPAPPVVVVGGTPPIGCGDVIGPSGGGPATSMAPGSTMSTWNGSAWHAVAGSRLPVLVPPPGLSDDPSSGGLLLGAADGWWTVVGNTVRTHGDAALRWRSGAAMAGDPGRGEVVLFGGLGPGGFGADTWTWDGSALTHRAGPVLVQPSPHVIYGIPQAPQPVQVNPAAPAPLPLQPGAEP